MSMKTLSRSNLFPHYPTIIRSVEAASDHAAIYANIA